MLAFHGSPHRFDQFDRRRIGHGNDQYGPGIYLSKHHRDAELFATKPPVTSHQHAPTVHRCRIERSARLVPQTMARPIDQRVVKTLLESGPHGECFAEDIAGERNWIASYMLFARYPIELVSLIANDAWRGFAGELVERFASLTGIDGVRIERPDWYVIYNVSSVSIIGHDCITDALDLAA